MTKVAVTHRSTALTTVVGSSPEVLIVGPADDPHAQAVQTCVRSEFDKTCAIFDLADLAEFGAQFATGEPDKTSVAIGSLCLEQVESIWWRRPRPPRIADADVNQAHTRTEWEHFAEGLLMTADARWVNEPVAQLRASRRLVQLQAAQQAGLRVPRTVSTSDPERAMAFVRSVERCIFKRIGTGSGISSYTRFADERVLERLGALRTCPVTFQEYVEPGYDLRVSWIAGTSFAMKSQTELSESPEDSRLDYTVPHVQTHLSPDLEDKLSVLMRNLGLVFGAIDLRVSRSEIPYFLEVNPGGQFAFVEILTGMPILKAMASLLASGSVDGSQRTQVA